MYVVFLFVLFVFACCVILCIVFVVVFCCLSCLFLCDVAWCVVWCFRNLVGRMDCGYLCQVLVYHTVLFVSERGLL